MREKKETETSTQSEGEEAGSDPAGSCKETLEREIWEAQPLSLANTARLIRLLAGQLIRKIILRQPGLIGASDSEVLTAILEVLEEKSLAEFLSIAVDQPPEVIKENYEAAKAMAALIDFLAINNFGAIWGEARRAAGAGQARKKKRRRRRSVSKK